MNGDTLTYSPVGPAVQGLIALLQRALRMDEHSLVRLRQREEHVEAFVATPYNVLASRRLPGRVSRSGVTTGAQHLLDTFTEHANHPGDEVSVGLGVPMDASWAGALPPEGGYTLANTVPVIAVTQLADQGQALAKQFSGPLGPPRSLLDQTVITVSPDEGVAGPTVEVPMRMVFACTSLGLIPGFREPVSIPRYLRVSQSGSWVRMDAAFGTVYFTKRLPLF